jgi:mono/diheme cytochrome c family protein
VSRRAIGIAALVLVAVVTAGCGAVAHISSGNPATGRTLFVSKCGSCHTLANAKTQGIIGPNLDDAFASDKKQGFHVSTIVDIVRGQIAYPDPEPGTICQKTLTTKAGKGLSCSSAQGMTPNLVHGQDARDVAVYVGLCSADPSCVVKNETVKIPS